MVVLSKGANTVLSASDVVVLVRWTGAHEVDASALLVGANDKVASDDDFVFYNQPQAAGGAVRHLGGTGEQRLRVRLAALPAQVERVVLAASVYQGAFGGVTGLELLVNDTSGNLLVRYPVQDASSETALVLGELYRRSGQWKVRAIGQGYDTGLAGLATDYGVTVDDAPGEDVPQQPAAPPSPAQSAPDGQPAPPQPTTGPPSHTQPTAEYPAPAPAESPSLQPTAEYPAPTPNPAPPGYPSHLPPTAEYPAPPRPPAGPSSHPQPTAEHPPRPHPAAGYPAPPPAGHAVPPRPPAGYPAPAPPPAGFPPPPPAGYPIPGQPQPGHLPPPGYPVPPQHPAPAPAGYAGPAPDDESALPPDMRQRVSLSKRAVGVVLQQKGLTGIRAKVALALDASASMLRLYADGTVRRVVERMAPVAARLDAHATLDAWIFASEFARLPGLRIPDLPSWQAAYIPTALPALRPAPFPPPPGVRKSRLSLRRNRSRQRGDLGYGNDEPQVMADIIGCHQRESSGEPLLVLLFSDGGIHYNQQISDLLRYSSRMPIFWQFVGLGNADYGILESLDTLSGRIVDNAGFFSVDDIDRLSDEELYERLLTEFPRWIQAARAAGILR